MTPTPTAGIEPTVTFYCTNTDIIRYSRKLDTKETIEQIKPANARRDAICGPDREGL